MYELTGRTRGHTVRSGDLVLIWHLMMLWLAWRHVVTLTRLIDVAPTSSSPTLPVPRG